MEKGDGLDPQANLEKEKELLSGTFKELNENNDDEEERPTWNEAYPSEDEDEDPHRPPHYGEPETKNDDYSFNDLLVQEEHTDEPQRHYTEPATIEKEEPEVQKKPAPLRSTARKKITSKKIQPLKVIKNKTPLRKQAIIQSKPKDKISIVVPLGKNSTNLISKTYRKYVKNSELITQIGTNPSANRNRGAEKAKGTYVAFLNGHSTLTPEWEQNVHTFFEEHPEISIVGGPQLTHKNEQPLARATGYALSSVFGAADVASRYSKQPQNLNADERHLTSSNLIVKKQVFKNVKFDETLWPGEDPKFISDAKKKKHKIAYSPEITVYNQRRASYSQLVKQFFNYGKIR